MNLLLAAHALGYVAGWITGWQAYSPMVNAAFCNEASGSAASSLSAIPPELEERPRPPLSDVSRPWPPPLTLTLVIVFAPRCCITTA